VKRSPRRLSRTISSKFVTREIDIDTDLIPVYANEDAARAAGHVEGDIFQTPGGNWGW